MPTLGVFGMLVKKIIGALDALEKRLDNKSRKEALSVVASAINSFTDRVLLIPLQIQHKSKIARGAYFELLESGDRVTREMAAQLLSDSRVDISVDEFLRLRREICLQLPRNRIRIPHDIADPEEFAEALRTLQLGLEERALLTRLHFHELEADFFR